MGLKLFYGTLTLLPHEAPELDGATFVERVQTAPRYRLFSLDDFPALLEQADGGFRIDAEIWDVAETRWQELLLEEPPEYYVFSIELDDGRRVDGVTAPAELVRSRGVGRVEPWVVEGVRRLRADCAHRVPSRGGP